MLKKTVILSILLITLILNSSAQDKYLSASEKVSKDVISSGELRKQALNVFLDCRWCDHTYIKKTIPYVNYVRNKDEADVHIFVRRQINGGGGGEYLINFIGHGDFEGINEELKFVSPVDETADETRKARSGIIAMGLMQYVARTPIGRNIKIEFEDGDIPGRIMNPTVENDSWDSWMFRLRGSGSFNQDENYKSSNINTTFSADRITEELKITFDARYENRQTYYTQTDSKSYRQNWSLNGTIVKSIADRWALGGRYSTSGDTYNNYDFSASAGPAIEYNFFPYEESFQHSFRVQYGVSGIYHDYSDTTTYFDTEGLYLRHYLSASIGFNKEWGSGYLSVTGANYLHDFNLNNLGIRGDINYRIYKGLSVNFETRASLIHDQINLPKGDASEQDVLTRQIALKTGYSFSFEFGLSYSFGSIYNNVVNTRFGN